MLRSVFKLSNCCNIASKNNFQPIRSFRRARVGAKKVTETISWKSGTVGIGPKLGPMEVGKIAVAGSAAIGLGALCYTGLGLASGPGAIDDFAFWPENVRSHVSATYFHLGGSLATAAGAAIAMYRSPHGQRFMNWCNTRPILAIAGTLAALVASGTVMRSIPYESPLASKYAAWFMHNSILGAIVAPVTLVSGSLAIRAACLTLGLVGGLSMIALCAPNDQFLTWAGPLGIGCGGVIAASLASVFIPPTSTLGLSLYSISLYGGLILFSCYLLYDTQKVIHRAKNHKQELVWKNYEPTYVGNYDPINESSHIVMDFMQIFIRIVQILILGGGRKK